MTQKIIVTCDTRTISVVYSGIQRELRTCQTQVSMVILNVASGDFPYLGTVCIGKRLYTGQTQSDAGLLNIRISNRNLAKRTDLMHSTMQISQQITSTVSYADVLLEFLRAEMLDGGVDLDEYTPLLEYGVIDSLSMVSVLSFIREQFGIEVRGEEIAAKNFRDVMSLANMVERLTLCGQTVTRRKGTYTAPLTLV